MVGRRAAGHAPVPTPSPNQPLAGVPAQHFVHMRISVWYIGIVIEERGATAGTPAPVSGHTPALTTNIVRWLVHWTSILWYVYASFYGIFV